MASPRSRPPGRSRLQRKYRRGRHRPLDIRRFMPGFACQCGILGAWRRQMIFGVAMVITIIAVTAVVSGLRVRSTREFTVAGHRAGWPIVSGIIVGALVGGSSTVGTAQAAFVYGLPAWWFTLGAGIGCLILGTLLVRALNQTGLETLPQYLTTAFGQPSRPAVAVSDSI